MKPILAILLLALSLSTQAQARTERSHAATQAFKWQRPCPATGDPRGPCPGWTVDHIIPLACGGADSPDNMQWQTRDEARAKDRWERLGCLSRIVYRLYAPRSPRSMGGYRAYAPGYPHAYPYRRREWWGYPYAPRPPLRIHPAWVR